MKTTWEKVFIDEKGEAYHKTMIVGDLYKENEMLMDLSKQPQELRDYMFEEIAKKVENAGKYNNFKMLQFLGKHQLNQILNKLNDFIPMFSCGTGNRVRLEELGPSQKTQDPNEVISFE